MEVEISKQQKSLIENISSLKASRNPFWVFFILADLKDIFINIWENLLNSIELNYSKEARIQYKNIIWKYKDTWIFESIYNHYLHNNKLKKFKLQIDDYFEHSFFIDISFYFFTISKNEKYSVLFDLISKFYFQERIKNDFFLLGTYLEKKQYLWKISKDFLKIENDKDGFFIINFLNNFKYFDFTQVYVSFTRFSTLNNIKVIKKIVIYILQNKEKYIDLYWLILETFVFNWNIYEEIIENFEEKKLFEIILFLKNDIHSWIDYSFTLDYSTKTNIKKYLEISKDIDYLSLEEKIKFLLEKENNFLSLWWEKWNFARVNFKRQFLEENYSDIIDLILWITDIPVEVFYLLKQQNLDINLDNLSFYNEIKDLILYIENSYFLSFIKPFLLRKISMYFNNSDQKYYIVKFILSVILSNSYSEYKKISKFFYNLEAFSKRTFESFFLRLLQFWWIIIFVWIIGIFLPFWVFLAILLFIFKEFLVKIIEKINPKIKLSLNFQFWTFMVFLAIFSVFLWWTIWYKDNIYLSYNYLKPIINATILPAHQTIKLLKVEIKDLRANILWWKNDFVEEDNLRFSDIDYLNKKTLQDLQENK